MLSKKEMELLCHMRANARQRLTSISRTMQTPVSTLFDKLRIQERKYIKKYTTLIDFDKLGFNTVAKIVLKVKKEDRDAVRDYLIKHQNVNSFLKINNGYDFMAEVVFRHIKELEDFIENLERKFSIKSNQVYYIIDDIKRECFMDSPMALDLLGEPVVW